jgi:hypothetical protein
LRARAGRGSRGRRQAGARRTASAAASCIVAAGRRWAGRPPRGSAALLGVGAVEADDQLLREVAEPLGRLDDAVGDLLAAGDAAEDVDEHALDVGSLSTSPSDSAIASADAPPPTSRKLAARPPFCATTSSVAITRPGAVAEHPDVAVELDVLDALGLGLGLERVVGVEPSIFHSS